MKTNKSYTDLIKLKTFNERYEYLKLQGVVCRETFGYERRVNQLLYKSPQWYDARLIVIIRDNGCDLSIDSRPIRDKILVHHIEPISLSDIRENRPCVFDPNNLICVSHTTHNAIHFGDNSQLKKEVVERVIGDTKLW